MGINIIRELYYDGCRSIMRELEQSSPEVISAKNELKRIQKELYDKHPEVRNLIEKYEDAEIQLKEEEASDLFQEGFVLGFLFAKKVYTGTEGSKTKEER